MSVGLALAVIVSALIIAIVGAHVLDWGYGRYRKYVRDERTKETKMVAQYPFERRYITVVYDDGTDEAFVYDSTDETKDEVRLTQFTKDSFRLGSTRNGSPTLLGETDKETVTILVRENIRKMEVDEIVEMEAMTEVDVRVDEYRSRYGRWITDEYHFSFQTDPDVTIQER